MVRRAALVAALALALTACQERTVSSNKHLQPIPPQTLALMASKGMDEDDPILVRVFKMESELEVWKKGRDGRYALLDTYPICRWSGQLGPKMREGDRQAPEGFYAVSPALMNPNSSFYLSFNTGFPNEFDRANGRTGSFLMVHGSCTSRGCFAMTDEAIGEVYALAREAFEGGQRAFQFQSYPFRMTPENLAQSRYDPNIAFWRNLKEGWDHFEVTRLEPSVEVCGGRYSFGTRNCTPADPTVTAMVRARAQADEIEVARLIESGEPAVRVVYEDGGGHPSFGLANAREMDVASATAFAALDAGRNRNDDRLGIVSRPEALAAGPRLVPVDSRGRPLEEATPTAVAAQTRPAAPAAAPVATASVPAAAPQAPAEAREPFYARMLGGLFSTLPLGGTPAPRDPATAPVPPQRGASVAPGTQPLWPSSGYSSLD
ncbi:L,D-transpeptidase family protein [Salinarimonas rosea]|uniref:L,D-transpeptidase family protein n=1 Tax=Salinarimonas rosea TaxID=552063 RepID=UPI0004167B55|nr:murein L,D-transpeptidase family protein [Salinarimonas rosea]